MTLRLNHGFAALGCILIASCYPYDENSQKPVKKTTPEQTVTSPEQQKIKADREKLKKEGELAKKEEIKPRETAPSEKPQPTAADTTPKPPVQEKREYSVANKVPGKEGFVFSPFNNKVVDVRDIPSGTLVQDPTYPAAEKKYFRVP